MTRSVMLKYARDAILAGLALSIPTAVSAASSGDVVCTLATTPLLFGEYVPYQGTPADSTATITITCTTSGVATERWNGTIALTVSGESSGRQLKQGKLPVAYQIYLDPARTQAWSDHSGDGGLLPVSGIVGPTSPYRLIITIYGRIQALQKSSSVGHYADIVTAVLDY